MHSNKSRLSLTPNSYKPIQLDIQRDVTPTRSTNISYIDTTHQHSIQLSEIPITSYHQQTTGRAETTHQRTSMRNNASDNFVKLHKNFSEKENLVRVPGNSFSGKEPTNKELQQTINEMKKQKESICFTLAETLKRNQTLKDSLNTLQTDKQVQAQQYQANLDQFVVEMNNLHCIINKLEQENEQLNEQCENQQWYIEQLEEQQKFNVTQEFGLK